MGIYFINNFIGTNLNSIIDVEDNTEIDIELISGGITIYKDNRSLGLKLLADGTIHKILFTNNLKVSGIGILFVNEIVEDTSQQETVSDTYHVSTLPTIASDILGSVKQYIGTTNSNYIKGYFYEAQSVLTNTPQEESLTVTQTAGVTGCVLSVDYKQQIYPIYENRWVNINVQPEEE